MRNFSGQRTYWLNRDFQRHALTGQNLFVGIAHTSICARDTNHSDTNLLSGFQRDGVRGIRFEKEFAGLAVDDVCGNKWKVELALDVFRDTLVGTTMAQM